MHGLHMTVGWALVTLTILLTAAGAAVYATGHVGWAQLAWVAASGTAGGSVALFIQNWHDRDVDEIHYWHRRPPKRPPGGTPG
jgi:4-hydroxybenzoate polyprenyltransferase